VFIYKGDKKDARSFPEKAKGINKTESNNSVFW